MELKLQSPKIFVAHTAVDFRKGIDGLGEYIQSTSQGEPKAKARSPK